MQSIIALLATAPRTTCNELLETTDGDVRALVQARIKVLDGIQFEAQKIIYTQTPPGMVDSWQLREWWFENFQTLNIESIDFYSIAEGKKMEWYAYSNEQVETQL
jgi:hypothetical protein